MDPAGIAGGHAVCHVTPHTTAVRSMSGHVPWPWAGHDGVCMSPGGGGGVCVCAGGGGGGLHGFGGAPPLGPASPSGRLPLDTLLNAKNPNIKVPLEVNVC